MGTRNICVTMIVALMRLMLRWRVKRKSTIAVSVMDVEFSISVTVAIVLKAGS